MKFFKAPPPPRLAQLAIVITLLMTFDLQVKAQSTCGNTITISNSNSNAIICANTPLTLTATCSNPTVNYYWTTGATTSSINIAPNTTTQYIAYCTDSNDCTNSDTITVNIASPVASINQNKSIICPGGTDSLHVLVQGDSNLPFSYSWFPTYQLSCTNCAAPVATPFNTTQYLVQVTDALGCVTNAATSGMVVVDVDNFAAGIQYLVPPSCPGNSIVLYGSVQGGERPYRYLWSPDNSTGTTDSVVVYSGSLFALTITDTLGCIASKSAPISPADQLSISLPQALTVCSGNIMVPGGQLGQNALCVNVYGGVQPYTYLWNVTANNTNSCVPISANMNTGIYSVSVSDSNGCTVSAACYLTFSQSPNVKVSASANMLHQGMPDTLTAQGATNYQWSNGATGSTIIVHPLKTVEVYAYGWDSNGCAAQKPAGMPIIIADDYWKASTSSYETNIYFPDSVGIGNVKTPKYNLEVGGSIMADSTLLIGADSGLTINGKNSTITTANRNKTVSFGGDTVATTGTVKAGNIITNKITLRDTIEVPVLLTDRIRSLPGDSGVHLGDSSIVVNNYSNSFVGTGGGIGVGSNPKPAFYSVAMGFQNKVNQSYSEAIGYYLTNNIEGSILMGGYNSTNHIPALSIIPDMTNGSPGFVGIGTTSPSGVVDIENPATSNPPASLYVQAPSPATNGGYAYGIIEKVDATNYPLVDAFALNDVTTGEDVFSVSGGGNADLKGSLTIFDNLNPLPNNAWTTYSGSAQQCATCNVQSSGGWAVPIIIPNGGAIRTATTYTANVCSDGTAGRYLGFGMVDDGIGGGGQPSTGWYWIIENTADQNTTTAVANYPMTLIVDANDNATLTLMQNNWQDYVFAPDYHRMTIAEKEQYYILNKHLPGIDPAAVVEKKGLNMNKNISGMLQNLEEDRLDITALNKIIEQQQKEIDELKKEVKSLIK